MKKLFFLIMLVASSSSQALHGYYFNITSHLGTYSNYRDYFHVIGSTYDEYGYPSPFFTGYGERYFDAHIEIYDYLGTRHPFLPNDYVTPSYSAVWHFDMLDGAFSITATDVICIMTITCPLLDGSDPTLVLYDGITFDIYSPSGPFQFEVAYYFEDDPVTTIYPAIHPTPIPAAAWLFGSALLGLGVIKRKRA